ncbi:MAG: NINE protein [Saprospiraceae bacterium]|nr:NINE protein [Saprospiraceae bacterium]
MKNKWMAAILALTLGGWGVHRFYLRQTELGLLYIGMTIFLSFKILGFGLVNLLGWYDAFKLMMMTNEEFDQKFNNINFRDRYGNKRKHTPEQYKRQGKYILLDEDEVTTQKTGGYFDKFKKEKEASSYKQSAIRKLKDFDIKGAIEDFNKALEKNPNDIGTHYNLACAYSLNEKSLESFKHLDLAVQLGFNEGGKIQSQEELAYIRVLPVYEKFKNNRFRLTQEMVDELKNYQNNLLEELKKQKEQQIPAQAQKSSYSILFQEYLREENK